DSVGVSGPELYPLEARLHAVVDDGVDVPVLREVVRHQVETQCPLLFIRCDESTRMRMDPGRADDARCGCERGARGAEKGAAWDRGKRLGGAGVAAITSAFSLSRGGETAATRA